MSVPLVKIKPENISRLGNIKSESASNMTLSEIRSLDRWTSGWNALFDNMNLQEVLNVYRIFIDSGHEEFNDFRMDRRFPEAWNAVTRPRNRMI